MCILKKRFYLSKSETSTSHEPHQEEKRKGGTCVETPQTERQLQNKSHKIEQLSYFLLLW